jgi:GNAT superfamily N-acetyltransferase
MTECIRLIALNEVFGERRVDIVRQIKVLFIEQGWSGSDINKWGMVANPEMEVDASIPFTLVALSDSQEDLVLGTASIVARDRKDLSFGPWLAGLVVHPGHRREGIGTKLVQNIEAYARGIADSLSEPILYLDTERTFQEDQPEWYERRGWKLIDETRRHDRSKLVMLTNLG